MKNITVHLKNISLILCLINSSFLTGCASIMNGTTQSISVETPPTTGALCSLTNKKGTWFINSTPGTVIVHRSYSALDIKCKKSGYEKADKSVKATMKLAVAGNVLVGGVLGVSVDAIDGAAYGYPTDIQVPMQAVDE